MKKIYLSTVVSALLVTTLNADFLGAEAGVATWSSTISGDIQGSGIADTRINFENNLGYTDKKMNSYIWAYVDHPLPFLPNIRIEETNFNSNAMNKSEIIFNNVTYSGDIKSQIDINEVDIIPYWRLLDNWVNLDLGFDFKRLNVKLTLDDGVNDTVKEVITTVPMLYAKARFDIPMSGFSIEADMSYLGYSKNKISSMKTGVVYQTSFGFGANAGYKSTTINIKNVSDTTAEFKTSGLYLGIFYHF